MYCKGLTREDLERYGIINVLPNGDSWEVVRYWYKNNSKTIKEVKSLKILKVKGVTKYATPKVYLKVSFNYRGTNFSFPLHRLVWAWHNGEVPDGYEVDHIDNNPFNNSLDNLQLLTTLENRRKRWSNPDNACNQWQFMDEFDKGIARYERFCKRQRKKIEKELKQY